MSFDHVFESQQNLFRELFFALNLNCLLSLNKKSTCTAVWKFFSWQIQNYINCLLIFFYYLRLIMTDEQWMESWWVVGKNFENGKSGVPWFYLHGRGLGQPTRISSATRKSDQSRPLRRWTFRRNFSQKSQGSWLRERKRFSYKT